MARFLGAAFFILLFAPAAEAEQTCHARDTVISYLRQTFREEPVAMGAANNGGVIEVYSNAERKTWTILITMPNGMTCMVAAGRSWESLPAILPSTGPKA